MLFRVPMFLELVALAPEMGEHEPLAFDNILVSQKGEDFTMLFLGGLFSLLCKLLVKQQAVGVEVQPPEGCIECLISRCLHHSKMELEMQVAEGKDIIDHITLIHLVQDIRKRLYVSLFFTVEPER